MDVSTIPAEHKLTEAQEADYVLDDIFEDDNEGCSDCIQQLCEEEGIAYDPEELTDEINQLIIDKEDRLLEIYAEYQNQQ